MNGGSHQGKVDVLPDLLDYVNCVSFEIAGVIGRLSFCFFLTVFHAQTVRNISCFVLCSAVLVNTTVGRIIIHRMELWSILRSFQPLQFSHVDDILLFIHTVLGLPVARQPKSEL